MHECYSYALFFKSILRKSSKVGQHMLSYLLKVYKRCPKSQKIAQSYKTLLKIEHRIRIKFYLFL